MNPTILLVDDELSALDSLEAILDGQGYTLEVAHNGREALEKANALSPDLILLDVMMPDMNGFDVCRILRATPKMAEVPIVILTALEDRSFRLEGIEVGADDFLTKPLDRQELLARVRTITRLNRYRTLLEQRENLKQMANRLIAAQEEERRRISRELHDEFGQALTAHNLNLHNLRSDLECDTKAYQTTLDRLIADTSDLQVRIRQLAQDLRPPMLDTLGFSTAMITYCNEFSRRSNIPIQVHIDPKLGELTDPLAIILYRILQESLTNISKHAQASNIWVDLTDEGERIALMVQDNGIGFDLQAEQKTGIGLTGIRERLALVGGELDLRSRKGHGTILCAYFPADAGGGKGKEMK